MTRALLIVDVQNDFTEGGALATDGGSRVARDVTAFARDRRGDYALVAASRDWHDPDSDNGGHFAADPDFVDTWPVHCVAGTPGAEYHGDLDTAVIDVHVRKGQGVPDYSAFQGTTEDGRGLAAALRQAGATELDVVGIATDHCVRASALDALGEGFAVRVLDGFTAAVGAESRESALDEVRAAGGEVVARV